MPSRAAYALWAERYPPRPHNPLMQVEQSVVESILAATSPRRALDVGTGTGRYLPVLASAGARLTVGLDLSMPMLAHHEREHRRVCGDACHLPFPNGSFDVICSSLMAGDVERLDQWTAEAARVLAPGGHLVYSDFHPSWIAQDWRRTFCDGDGRLIELPYFPHTIDEHLALLERAPLAVRAIREPRIDARQAPVVVVFHATKSPRPC